MPLSPEQVKGKIKNLAIKKNADARLLIRLYMMDRFLERLSISKYRDNFIIKGGILVTSMVGISSRSTMDIDVSITNINLNEQEIKQIINEIINIDLNDGIKFESIKIEKIMDLMEYPGIRIDLVASMSEIITPLNIDISTGDAITPSSINYKYNVLLEDKSINLKAYNIETILSEKIQTILVRGVFNTRMRDFYDIYALMIIYFEQINKDILYSAFMATCATRNTNNIIEQKNLVIDMLEKDSNIQNLWSKYQKKYIYANDITFDMVIEKVKLLLSILKS